MKTYLIDLGKTDHKIIADRYSLNENILFFYKNDELVFMTKLDNIVSLSVLIK